MSNITSTTAANFIPEVWSKKIQLATEAALVMAKLVDRFDADAQVGDTIHVPHLSNLAANAKLANTSVTLQAPTEAKTDISLDKHYETSFLIEDIVKAQSYINLEDKYTQKAGYAIAKEIDDTLHALYTGLSQSVAGGASALALTDINTAAQFLDLADAPQTERFLVVSPYAKQDLLQIDTIIEADKANTDAGLRKANVGEIFGFDIYMSTQTTKVTTVSHNLAFHKEAFGLAMQISPKTEMQRKAEYTGDLVVTQALWGVQEMRDDFAVDVQSLAS